jgi:hypothetical protein
MPGSDETTADLLRRASARDEATRVDALSDLAVLLEQRSWPAVEARPIVQAILDAVDAENGFDVEEAIVGCLLRAPPVSGLDLAPVLRKLGRDEHCLVEYLGVLFLAGPAWWPKIELYRTHESERVRAEVESFLPPGRLQPEMAVKEPDKEEALARLGSPDEAARVEGTRDLAALIRERRFLIPELRPVLGRAVRLVRPENSQDLQWELLSCLLDAPTVRTWPRLLPTSLLGDLDLDPLLVSMDRDEALLPMFLDVLYEAGRWRVDPPYRQRIDGYREHPSPGVRAKVESLLGPLRA